MPPRLFHGYCRRLGDTNGEEPPARQPDPAYHDTLIVVGDEVDNATAATTFKDPENMKVVAAGWLVDDGIILPYQAAMGVEQLLMDMTILATSFQETMLNGTEFISYQWQHCREEVSRIRSLSASSGSALAPIGIAAESSSSLAPIGIAAPSGSLLAPIEDAARSGSLLAPIADAASSSVSSLAPIGLQHDLTQEELDRIAEEPLDWGSSLEP